MQSKFPALYLCFGIMLTFAFSWKATNPPASKTGAPGETTCTSCHSTPSTTITGGIAISGFPATVMAGATYTLTVTSTMATGATSVSRAGFELTAINSANGPSGTLALTANTTNTSFIEATVSGVLRQYIRHSAVSMITTNGGTTTWTYKWTAPATQAAGTTNITRFFVAGVLANGTNSTSGDKVVTNVYEIPVQFTTPLQAAVAGTNVTCNGAANGHAISTASGATTPYTYLWSNGSTASVIQGLAPGNYTVTVTAANGTTATASTIIEQPTVLNVTASPAAESICPNTPISISATTTGGTAPYTYNWSNGVTTAAQSVTPTAVTTYTVTVTDNKGCTKTAKSVITPCVKPTANTNGGVTGTTVEVFWTGVTCSTSKYQVQYRPVGTTTYISKPLTAATALVLTGLTCNTQYQWRVRTKCVNNVYSAWSTVKTITTSACLNGENGGSSQLLAAGGINIFPNPASTSFTISMPNDVKEDVFNVALYNVQGQVIRTWQVSGTQATLSTEGLSKGMYILQVSNNDQQWQEKLLVD